MSKKYKLISAKWAGISKEQVYFDKYSMAGSCAIDFEAESVLALNRKLKVD